MFVTFNPIFSFSLWESLSMLFCPENKAKYMKNPTTTKNPKHLNNKKNEIEEKNKIKKKFKIFNKKFKKIKKFRKNPNFWAEHCRRELGREKFTRKNLTLPTWVWVKIFDIHQVGRPEPNRCNSRVQSWPRERLAINVLKILGTHFGNLRSEGTPGKCF